MMPGMYVIHQNRPAQVLRLVTTFIPGHGGLPVPATGYELATPAPEGSGYAYVVAADASKHGVNQDDHPSPPILPACLACGARAGWACVADCEPGMDARVPA